MELTESEQMNCMEIWGGNQAVQRSFQAPGLKVWIHSQPYGQALSGGDVYYLSSCASGRITRMLLADVSGHGEMVSATAVGLRDLMRRNINYIKQTRFVRAMNQQFADLSEEGGFATALVSTFFAPTKTFALCNAGHPAPLVFRRAESQWSRLHSPVKESTVLSDTPLGVIDDAAYGQLKVRLESGDMVLSFSDAIIESQDTDGSQLGQSGILRLVRELEVRDPEKLIPTLIERILGLRDSNLRQDDATFLLGQATGGGVSLKNNLLAPLRLFSRVADHTNLAESSPRESP